MIVLISPAKTLDFDINAPFESTQPRLKKYAKELIEVLRTKDVADIQSLMSLSEKLAVLNVERYHGFRPIHSSKNSKPALFAFKGDVYLGMDAPSMSEASIMYAQTHLRILSGLYGILKPLDLIQPYRLEMGTKLEHGEYSNLYQYWGDTIVKLLHKDLKEQGDKIIINLASQEYFKSVDRKSFKAKVINVEFLDYHNGEFKIISFFAKKARGLMSRFIMDNQINQVERLHEFHSEGYIFDQKMSTEDNLVFTRHKVEA